MQEIWKDIDGYEGLYQVSNLGNVKSLNYRKQNYSKNLTPKVNNCGRLWVELRKNGSRKQILIHRLVAIAFIPNENNFPQINHKDENTMNNVVENLEWCDAEYNSNYSWKRHPEWKKKSVPKNIIRGEDWKRVHKSHPGGWKNGPKDRRKIFQCSLNGEVLNEWNSISEVSRINNWNYSSIKRCCDGERKSAYGFKWQYAI